MKTEMKVLLYIKRSGQDKDGLSPLMGRIAVRGKNNSIAQFSCKFKVDVRLWNATAQRCIGKSRMAVMANREIERTLLLLRQRFNELKDIKEVVSAEEVKNAYQGLAESQDTIMKLFEEHNSDYALRVGVNRAVNTYYQYTNTYRHLPERQVPPFRHACQAVGREFHRGFRHVHAHRQAVYAQDHTRTCKPPEKRDDACRVPWHYPVQPVQRLQTAKAGVQADVPYGRGTGQVCKYDLRHAQPQFHEGHVPVLVLDGHLLLRHEGIDGEEPCKSRGRKPVDSYRTAEDRNARMCKADGNTARHLGEIQGHGCRR